MTGTTTAGVAALWSALVLARAWSLRPLRPPRLPSPVAGTARGGPIGRCPASTATPAWVVPTFVALAAAPVLLVAPAAVPVLVPLLVAAAVVTPRARARRAERRRRRQVVADLPDVVVLLRLAVASGATVTRAVDAVSRRGRGPLVAELGRMAGEVAGGRPLADCLEALPARAGEGVRPLSTTLLASERYGAPIVAGLDRLAADARADARRRADEAARRAPVKLAFPLVVCILPAFALLTVAPLLASAVRGLRL